MDVGDWLRSLGLGQYESAFRQNDVDAEVLGELTDGDLERLGLSLGHRKRLLKAIAILGQPATAGRPPAPAPPQTSANVAERRPITVMFCDSSARRALRRIWIPRTGAIWLGVTSTQPQPLRLHAAAIC